MQIPLAYGQGNLLVDLPDHLTTVITPAQQPGLADERLALNQKLDRPIGCAPLREWVTNQTKICIVFTDITRPTPNDRLIPWILAYLEDAGVKRDQITLLNGLGTHRPNTREELCKMLTAGVVEHYRVLNHEPENPEALAQMGHTRAGVPVLLNKHLLAADLRIITGFIEPHFFAGFSGGPKGIMPGVAGLQTVISNHGRANIGSPNAAFGITVGNPVWEEMRDIALRAGFSFLVNVALNERREITGIFAGDLIAAHAEGIEFVRASAMQPVEQPFEIVISTNSGYPLDLNLYQAVKGMSAAARIVKEGGSIIMAAECREGIPASSPFYKLLRQAGRPERVLELIAESTFPEQWQSQIQALIQRHAKVYLYSSLDPEEVKLAHLVPCPDIAGLVLEQIAKLGPSARIAVLPQGPLTIPYLRPEAEVPVSAL
ncbi:MAG: nickel-dependent lactate racemase [Methylacidiphilales bacterium]|nr:nickel-dependent lactate racemase [Candidatus Methylacidiphilales bacterium]